MTEISSRRMEELYQKCFDVARKLIYLPYGMPTLYVEDYPSEHFAAEEIAAVSNYGSNSIYVNKQWAEKCLRENVAEYEFILLHELRHFHQHAVIKHYRSTGQIKQDTKEEIEKWEFEFGHYIPNCGDDASRKANANQLCERDANAYGVILVNFLNIDNSLEINLGLPDGTENDICRYKTEKPEVRQMIEKLNTKPAYQEPVRKGVKIGRNDPCPCGSGLKHKKCKCAKYHGSTASDGTRS